MDLILPDFGLLFWTGLVFCCLLFILTKFAWKPILGAVNAREQKIAEALELAEKTKVEMQTLKSENEALLKEARAQRDSMLKDAKTSADKMIEEAKETAKAEAQKIVAAAKKANKAVGILFFNPDDYQRYHNLGIRFLACGADATFVAEGARTMAGKMSKFRNP